MEKDQCIEYKPCTCRRLNLTESVDTLGYVVIVHFDLHYNLGQDSCSNGARVRQN